MGWKVATVAAMEAQNVYIHGRLPSICRLPKKTTGCGEQVGFQPHTTNIHAQYCQDDTDFPRSRQMATPRHSRGAQVMRIAHADLTAICCLTVPPVPQEHVRPKGGERQCQGAGGGRLVPHHPYSHLGKGVNAQQHIKSSG